MAGWLLAGWLAGWLDGWMDGQKIDNEYIITSVSNLLRNAVRHRTAENSAPRKPRMARKNDHPYEY